MKFRITVTILFSIILLSCKSGEQLPNYGIDTSMEGIKGEVLWVEGNQMPGPGKKENEPEGIQRELYVFRLTNKTQAEGVGSIYKNIQTELVRKIVTDMNGAFVLALQPGEYSVFVREENGYFASITDGEGNLNPVVVEDGKFTDISIKVNYRAAY
ncbi:carboxypeptidase-like regulatory domain-containing protein [Chondrinema litorale]|uniref:carboxypeptidase-like regulatory domain-containing protein n=1 Tax=Chondrinema litorale TaxID=2994555 RepID=UPI002542E3BD|nr:carboxypeptidase-like regulatory domain-containing protein [Chondrinema litorale]UZR95080.1 carboxypeptidase-like regulatory domain-containing protein [Chondrinema litorale]